MKKPNVFVNKIDHKIKNNENMFSTFKSKNDEDTILNVDVNKKIKEIFNSPKYVYKIDTVIKTKKETMEKTIVGMNRRELLTLDNERIKIDDIIDINLKN